MKKRITFSILFIMILTLGLSSNAYARVTAYDLWPVQLGNQWTYIIEGQINNGHKFEVEVTYLSGGWAYLDGTDEFHGTGWGDRWWFMSHFSGNIWVWNSYYFSRVFNLTAGEGNQFTSRIRNDPCLNGAVWNVEDADATVETPVGTFNDCVIIANIDPPCADAGLTRMVFAPDVGPVEYSWTTIAGLHTAKLVHAVVNGIEYKRIEYTGGYSVSLNIDKITYKLIEEDQVQSPDTLNVKLKIENSTNETVTFTHSSSQEYDFIIRDDSGSEIYQWSNGKAFTTAITERTLEPGESAVFEESIDLKDNDNNPIKPGNYTIEGLHTTMVDEELRQRARAGFNIELETMP
jgi:hypothetical protein